MRYWRAFVDRREVDGALRGYSVCVHCRSFATINEAAQDIESRGYPEATMYVVLAEASVDVGPLVMDVFREGMSRSAVHRVLPSGG